MFFGRRQKLQQSLTRTRQSFLGRLAGLFGGNLTEATWQELEALLIQADVGVAATMSLVDDLRQAADRERIQEASALQEMLQARMVQVLGARNQVSPRNWSQDVPVSVILVVGVNGSGKTTSIAKLARYYQQQGRKVLLAAADTFRAAAIDQLKVWGQRVGADVVSHQPGADPGAVVFDSIQAARSRGAQVLIVDTAGRLHTKYNLMQELKKVRGVAAKQIPDAPHETLLVLDATTGQNALSQAKYFTEAVQVTGIVLAKLDGTAKGGIVFAITQELGIPIRFVGTGEGLDDFAEFDAEEFVQALFA